MVKTTVQLKDIEEVKDFVTASAKMPYDVDLIAGRYVINAKSIMGTLSLDLGRPLKVEIHTDDAKAYLDEIEPFIITEA